MMNFRFHGCRLCKTSFDLHMAVRKCIRINVAHFTVLLLFSIRRQITASKIRNTEILIPYAICDSKINMNRHCYRHRREPGIETIEWVALKMAVDNSTFLRVQDRSPNSLSFLRFQPEYRCKLSPSFHSSVKASHRNRWTSEFVIEFEIEELNLKKEKNWNWRIWYDSPRYIHIVRFAFGQRNSATRCRYIKIIFKCGDHRCASEKKEYCRQKWKFICIRIKYNACDE